MTRYHYFNYMYPEAAKQIDEGFANTLPIVWNAFTKLTGLNRFFSFTPSEIAVTTASREAGVSDQTPNT